MLEVEFEKLLSRYRNGECTPHETAEVESFFNYVATNSAFESAGVEFDVIGNRIWNNIHSKACTGQGKVVHRNTRRIWAAAAAAVIAIALFTGIRYYSDTKDPKTESISIATVRETPPGGNSAILKLADGQYIDLNTAKNGLLTTQNGVSIEKFEGGIMYKIVGTYNPDLSSARHTLTTPNGMPYKVILSDGSIIDLNAGSSLSYSPWMDGTERRANLKGEGFFAIAKNPTKPFIVSTPGQLVRVVGTHFNIYAYADEPVRTTVTEGSVIVSTLDTSFPQQYQLEPGKQSTMISGKLSIAKVDTANAIAWKKGRFVFDQKPIKEALLEIGRWYNVDISVSKDREAERLNMVWSRSSPLSKLLNEIEKTKNLKLQTKKIMQ